MNILIQIDTISISRASNAAHYEYLSTVKKRVTSVRLDNPLWTKAVEEFLEAFKNEDSAFKQYRASERTNSLREMDEERDKQYASLRDAIKTYAKFPIAATAQNAEPLIRVIQNYKISTRENYMKESGLIDNMLQDLMQHTSQLQNLGLEELASQLRESNDRVRQLISNRNDERCEQELGELKAARNESDKAYAALVMVTNAYALLNADRHEATDLVKQMQQDLEYFRRYAMPDPHRARDAKQSGDEITKTDEPAV